jgi:4-hydroxybenzoate polyprenyltransferase
MSWPPKDARLHAPPAGERGFYDAAKTIATVFSEGRAPGGDVGAFIRRARGLYLPAVRRIAAILRFIRFPLVWTAMADSLAAAAVALSTMPVAHRPSLWQLAPLLLVSPGMYLFGMGINDLLDVREDRHAGRDRPLVRGELSAAMATGVVVFLLGVVMIGAAYVNLAGLKMIALTLACITVYNMAAKRWLITSAVVMSGCRVGNILVGWGVVTGSWRFDLSPGAPYAWGLVVSVAVLTAAASVVSGLEKRFSLRTVAGRSPSAIILGTLLLLPVADGVNVMIAWGGALWPLAWWTAVPLVLASGAVVRRLRGPVP